MRVTILLCILLWTRCIHMQANQREFHSWETFRGKINDFHLRFRDCFPIWNSPRSVQLEKSYMKQQAILQRYGVSRRSCEFTMVNTRRSLYILCLERLTSLQFVRIIHFQRVQELTSKHYAHNTFFFLLSIYLFHILKKKVFLIHHFIKQLSESILFYVSLNGNKSLTLYQLLSKCKMCA